MLFGKPPFTAGNMIDLLKNIKNKPINFPRNINNISEVKKYKKGMWRRNKKNVSGGS